MADLVGIAAIIGVIGSPLAVVFSQYNARKKVKEDIAAALTITQAAAKKDADEHLRILNEQTGTLARVEGNTDGALSAAQAISKRLGIQKDALAIEVERLQPGSSDATPDGVPTAEAPVGMVDGHAKAFPGATAAPAVPDLNEGG